MNLKTKSLAGLMSLAVVSSLVVLSMEQAWSESPRKHAGKKSVFKKAKVAKKKTLSPASVPAEKSANGPVAQLPPPTLSSQPALTPTQSVTVAKQVIPVASPATATSATSIPPANPYMAGQYPNPWKVETSKPVPLAVNPYLAYRYSTPAAPTASAPTPWSAPTTPNNGFALPVLNNPFLTFQAPFPQAPTIPATPWTPPVFQFPQAPAAANPYLPGNQAAASATPWSVPSFQIPRYTSTPVAAALPIPLPIPQPSMQVTSQATPWTPPTYQAPQIPAPAFPAPSFSAPTGVNPYLAYRQVPAQPVSAQLAPPQPAAIAPSATQTETPKPAQSVERAAPTPWTVPSPSLPALSVPANLAPTKSLGDILSDLKYALVPGMPSGEQSILPVIKTVYPTGEKPLKVLTFKCPTELLGVTPIPVKAVHGLVNLAMDGLNSTNLLPFNMQQVCQ